MVPHGREHPLALHHELAPMRVEPPFAENSLIGSLVPITATHRIKVALPCGGFAKLVVSCTQNVKGRLKRICLVNSLLHIQRDV